MHCWSYHILQALSFDLSWYLSCAIACNVTFSNRLNYFTWQEFSTQRVNYLIHLMISHVKLQLFSAEIWFHCLIDNFKLFLLILIVTNFAMHHIIDWTCVLSTSLSISVFNNCIKKYDSTHYLIIVCFSFVLLTASQQKYDHFLLLHSHEEEKSTIILHWFIHSKKKEKYDHFSRIHSLREERIVWSFSQWFLFLEKEE